MNKMNKRNIILGGIGLILFLSIGLGFYSVFSKADAGKSNASENKVVAVNKGNSNESKKVDESKDVDSKKEDSKKEDSKDKEDTKVSKDDVEVVTNKNEGNSSNEVVKNNNSNNMSSNEENKTSTPSDNGGNKPVEGKPEVTPEPAPVPKKTVTISISCETAINSGVNKNPGFEHLPGNGVILGAVKAEFKEGETVFDVLQRVTRNNGIHMEYRGSGSTIYIEGINNLYEFDGGPNSGWMYSVNGWYPNYGAGVYNLKDGDVIQWNYTCNLGEDLGAGWNGQ